MATVYVVGFVPASARDTAEALVGTYLQSPNDPGVYTFGVPLVPLPGPADAATPTAYGTCASMRDDSGLYSALPALTAAVPGTTYHIVSRWREFQVQRDWLEWLAGYGLQPQAQST